MLSMPRYSKKVFLYKEKSSNSWRGARTDDACCQRHLDVSIHSLPLWLAEGVQLTLGGAVPGRRPMTQSYEQCRGKDCFHLAEDFFQV